MTIFLFLLGLAFGSFLNVLIFRYNPDENADRRGLCADLRRMLKTMGGRSRCLHCQKTLRWFELIPIISWIVQWGKCRGCKKRISLQYPIVELASGVMFVFVPALIRTFLLQNWAVGSVFPIGSEIPAIFLSAFWIVLFLIFIAAFFIDVRHYVIPNYLNLSIFIGGVVWTVVGQVLSFGGADGRGSFLGTYAGLFTLNGVEGFWSSFLFNHLLGAVVGAGFFLLVIFLTHGKGMGMGDAKLMAGIGLLFGYPDVLVIMATSFILGSLYALPLLAAGKRGMKSMLPFGPFIALAAMLIFFFGNSIIGGYFGILQHIGMGL